MYRFVKSQNLALHRPKIKVFEKVVERGEFGQGFEERLQSVVEDTDFVGDYWIYIPN